MTNRSRVLALLLGLVLVLPAAPGLGQADGDSRAMGDIVADALMDLARQIGSAQGDISDLADGIDPSDPADGIDPGDPDGGIDPSDPGANPGEFDPDHPAAPGPGADDVPEPEPADEIDLPAPAEPEEGGFAEIQLLPDPVPLAGGWKVVNHPGRMTCTGIGTIALQKSEQNTRLAVKQDGRVLQGSSLASGAGTVKMTWQPNSEAYTGVVKVAAPEGKTRIRFYLRVVSPTKLKGEMVATVNVKAQGISGSCAGTRRITLTHR